MVIRNPIRGRTVDEQPTLRAGIILAPGDYKHAREKAFRMRFHAVHDPKDFVDRVLRATDPGKGHVVLAPTPAETDYAVCAQIVAAFMGSFFTTAEKFCEDVPCGITYKALYRQPEVKKEKKKHITHTVAVAADLGFKFPNLELVLRKIAESAAGCLELSLSEKKLLKSFRTDIRNKGQKAIANSQGKFCVLTNSGPPEEAPERERPLYITPGTFLLRLGGVKGAKCPGHAFDDA